MNFYLIKRGIKFFFQRMFRGWDDSETWSLDREFHKWILPRLKRFGELTCAYPDNKKYPTLEKWQEEIQKRVKQLEIIIKEDDTNFDDWSYIPKKKLNELDKSDIIKINIIAFCYMYNDFHKWFAKEVGWLWW